MTIQILPARLANQIAAGEVVERPASVIKELIENSLDSGATVIDVEVQKGGSKLIRIRDNGCGIAKAELGLALSRHATSKVSSFDDLENITSLGFRGEALASISSVSRLKLTSKPAAQDEAWQAYAEGRDMEVKVLPAAHPDGTTIEVTDLFFNTPARRKFLRTEKTEFFHIDEVIKRIALSRFDVQFSLTHNGKSIRHLRKAMTDQEKDRRVGQICGKSLVENVMRVNCDYDGVGLSGWIAMPRSCRNQNDVQFSYVNGRMMRDKLINHAIRQAYGSSLAELQYPTYVLFLTVSPRQIDVNVHPAKHEVRFHEARLIHDFIVQALEQALTAEVELAVENVPAEQLQVKESGSSYAGGANYQANKPSPKELNSYHRALSSFTAPVENSAIETAAVTTAAVENAPVSSQPIATTQQARQQTIQQVMPAISSPVFASADIGSCLTIVKSHYVLYLSSDKNDSSVYLIDLNKVNAMRAPYQYKDGLVGQPLLLPVKIAQDSSTLALIGQFSESLQGLGLEFQCIDRHVVVRKVPAFIRNSNIAQVVGSLFEQLVVASELALTETQMWQHCLNWLVEFHGAVLSPAGHADLSVATQIINDARQFTDEQTLVARCGMPVDIDSHVNQLGAVVNNRSQQELK